MNRIQGADGFDRKALSSAHPDVLRDLQKVPVQRGLPQPTAEEAELSSSGGSFELSADKRPVRLQDCQHGRNRFGCVLNPPPNRSRIGLAKEPPENRRGLEIDRPHSPRSRSRIRCAVPAGSRTGEVGSGLRDRLRGRSSPRLIHSAKKGGMSSTLPRRGLPISATTWSRSVRSKTGHSLAGRSWTPPP
jgi:hypothetical protein